MTNPATHQPTKAEMEKPVVVRAELDDLGAALVRGGAPRREPEKGEKETNTSRK